MTSIFHYTDVHGLLGILSSETLFATDYRYLNDATEAGSIRDLILPIFHAEIATITPKLIERKWLKKDYYEELGLHANLLQAEAMYRSFTRGLDKTTPFFVTSFCKHEPGSEEYNHGLLSQWRGYAQSGGFAIEFDETRFGSLMKAESEQYAYAVLQSRDVHYEQHEQHFDPDVYRGVAGEMIHTVFESQGIDVSEVTSRRDLDEVAVSFIKSAPLLKNRTFHEENEYRMIASPVRRNHIPPEETREWKPIEFRAKNRMIVPYIELFKDAPDPLPIKAVIVGPHPFQERQVEAVSMLLESQIFDGVEIRASAIPYRD
jgi:hypothetical protein